MKTGKNFEKLISVIASLRDPKTGCPWDIKQTHESLKEYLIEEAYEAIEAIDQGSAQLADELGDVLLQVVLHSQIASEEQTFTINDVIEGLTTKMINRHPHVFGDVVADTAEKVVENWEKIKQAEAKDKTLLSSIPKSLPALHKAHKIGEKVARVGFDWKTTEDVKHKIREEIEEVIEADQQHTEEELGDLLFSLVQLIRKSGYQSELVLQKGCSKFMQRFQKLEELATKTKTLEEHSQKELEKLWLQVK